MEWRRASGRPPTTWIHQICRDTGVTATEALQLAEDRPLTTLIIHHPVILPFQTQNFPISQILPSVDIWHLFGLISRIPGLLYGFSLCFSFFSSFKLSFFLPF